MPFRILARWHRISKALSILVATIHPSAPWNLTVSNWRLSKGCIRWSVMIKGMKVKDVEIQELKKSLAELKELVTNLAQKKQ